MFAADSRLPVSKVERIVEEQLPVRSNVERDRNRARRIDPRSGSINRQFADADIDAADAPIADPENRLGIGCYDQIDVVSARLGTE